MTQSNKRVISAFSEEIVENNYPSSELELNEMRTVIEMIIIIIPYT